MIRQLSVFIKAVVLFSRNCRMREAERFGGRLRELREGAGLNQKELAVRAGLTLDGLSRLERGNRSPTWETVLALANALGVSTEAFRQEPAPYRATGRRGRPTKAETETPAPAPPPKGKAAGGKKPRRRKGGGGDAN
jgi:transcriptional regulator with XRE-family HTH domain